MHRIVLQQYFIYKNKLDVTWSTNVADICSSPTSVLNLWMWWSLFWEATVIEGKERKLLRQALTSVYSCLPTRSREDMHVFILISKLINSFGGLASCQVSKIGNSKWCQKQMFSFSVLTRKLNGDNSVQQFFVEDSTQSGFLSLGEWAHDTQCPLWG